MTKVAEHKREAKITSNKEKLRKGHSENKGCWGMVVRKAVKNLLNLQYEIMLLHFSATTKQQQADGCSGGRRGSGAAVDIEDRFEVFSRSVQNVV